MRVTTRLISAMAAALLAVMAALVLVELALAALGRAPWIVDWRSLETFGQEHSWDSAAVRLIAVALLVIGLALLIAALRPRPPVTLDSRLGTEGTTITLRRRSLESVVSQTARSLDGVADATARWTGRTMRVDVTTRRAVVTGLDAVVGPRVDALMDAWRLDHEPARVVVRSISPQPAPLPAPPAPPGTTPGQPVHEPPIARWPADQEEALR